MRDTEQNIRWGVVTGITEDAIECTMLSSVLAEGVNGETIGAYERVAIVSDFIAEDELTADTPQEWFVHEVPKRSLPADTINMAALTVGSIMSVQLRRRYYGTEPTDEVVAPEYEAANGGFYDYNEYAVGETLPASAREVLIQGHLDTRAKAIRTMTLRLEKERRQKEKLSQQFVEDGVPILSHIPNEFVAGEVVANQYTVATERYGELTIKVMLEYCGDLNDPHIANTVRYSANYKEYLIPNHYPCEQLRENGLPEDLDSPRYKLRVVAYPHNQRQAANFAEQPILINFDGMELISRAEKDDPYTDLYVPANEEDQIARHNEYSSFADPAAPKNTLAGTGTSILIGASDLEKLLDTRLRMPL